MSTKEFNLLKQNVLDSINTQQITPSTIFNLVIQTMNILDKFSKLNGDDKKQMCMNIIYDIIDTSDNIIDKDFIIKILNSSFGTFIEDIIDISKGKTSINKNKILLFFTKISDFFKKFKKNMN